MESDAESELSDQPPVDIYVEEGELSEDQDVAITDPDQSLSEEQTYRETMRGIRSYMGWSHIPDMDTSAATSEDNPSKRVPRPLLRQDSSCNNRQHDSGVIHKQGRRHEV